MQNKRIILKSTDVIKIKGCSYISAWRCIQYLKDVYGRTKEQFVTIAEFCEQSGLNEIEVRKTLNLD